VRCGCLLAFLQDSKTSFHFARCGLNVAAGAARPTLAITVAVAVALFLFRRGLVATKGKYREFLSQGQEQQ